MSDLKIYSLRLESDSLEWADKVANGAHYWSRSVIIRVAIWVGSKVITSRNLSDIVHLQLGEEYSNFEVPLEEVLRVAGFSLENLKKVK